MVFLDSCEAAARSTVKVSGVTDISKAAPACVTIHHFALFGTKEHQGTVYCPPIYFTPALIFSVVKIMANAYVHQIRLVPLKFYTNLGCHP
jgi:hypothetical protein